MDEESNLSRAARGIFLKEDIRYARKTATGYLVCGTLLVVCFTITIIGDMRAGTHIVNWFTLAMMVALLAAIFWAAWVHRENSKLLSRQLASLRTR